MTLSMLKTKSLTIVLIVLLILLLGVYKIKLDAQENNPLMTDFGKFYRSAEFSLQQQNPYAMLLIKIESKDAHATQTITKYSAGDLNPPFFQLLILPLGHLSYVQGLWIWTLLSFISMLLSIFLLAKTLAIQRPTINFYLSTCLMMLVSYPVFTTFAAGQLGLIILPLTMGAWYAARQQHIRTAALLLGILVQIKLFFGLFGLYFLIRREFKAFIYFMLAIAVCGLLPLLFFTPKIYLQYFAILHHITWYSISWNASILGFAVRLFGTIEKNIPVFNIPGLATITYFLLAGLLVLWLIKFLWPNKNIAADKKLDLDFSVIIIAMLLLSPLGWNYYFPLFMIPFAVLLQPAQPDNRPLTLQLLTILALALVSYPLIMTVPHNITNAIISLGSASFYFYALLFLLGLIGYTRFYLMHHPQPQVTLPPKLLPYLYMIALFPALTGIALSLYKIVTPTSHSVKIQILRIDNL